MRLPRPPLSSDHRLDARQERGGPVTAGKPVARPAKRPTELHCASRSPTTPHTTPHHQVPHHHQQTSQTDHKGLPMKCIAHEIDYCPTCNTLPTPKPFTASFAGW